MLRLRAHAKLNLSLQILGLRPDGYHEIESLMQSVSLADIVTLTPIDQGIELSTSNLKLPVDSRNLAYKAAELFQTAVGGQQLAVNGIKIKIEKNIPLAAGLAGGSADAAVVLYGLNKLSGNPLSQVQLMELGAQIGSDVPFCLVGGSCTVKGRGELVTRNTINVQRHYIIVVPEVEVSSKWAYEAFDRASRGAKRSIGRNNLEAVVIDKYPVIQQIKEQLIELGCSYSQMSGSGSSVFGIINSLHKSEIILQNIRNKYARCFLATSVEQGVSEIA